MSLNENSKIILGGRLATYQYYDMHQIVAQALNAGSKHVERRPAEFSRVKARRAPVAPR